MVWVTALQFALWGLFTPSADAIEPMRRQMTFTECQPAPGADIAGPPVAVTTSPKPLTWDELPPIPDELGVAGPFVGVTQGALIVAGGANFPRPVWEQEKAWHDQVHVLTRTDSQLAWHHAGKLDRPIAYGATVSTPDGVVCMGGNDADTTFDSVFLLQWDIATKRIRTTPFPSLPQPCAYGAATLVGDIIYLAGGQSGLGLESAMTNFWSLDLGQRRDSATFRWQERTPWPGTSRAFNLTVHQRRGDVDRIYVISGRRQDGEATQFLTDVWEYTPSLDRWKQRRNAPRCVMAGTGLGFGNRQIFVLGGADGTLFFQGNELKDKHPGFRKEALVYDTIADAWTSAGPIPRNHVTTQAVAWEGGIVVASGEVRPRVRSPQVWKFQPAATPSPADQP